MGFRLRFANRSRMVVKNTFLPLTCFSCLQGQSQFNRPYKNVPPRFQKQQAAHHQQDGHLGSSRTEGPVSPSQTGQSPPQWHHYERNQRWNQQMHPGYMGGPGGHHPQRPQLDTSGTSSSSSCLKGTDPVNMFIVTLSKSMHSNYRYPLVC